MTGRLATVGHGAADRSALTTLLQGADVERLVDVRRFPNSRHNDDVRIDSLREWMPEVGIDYAWEERLGGRRKLPPAVDGVEPDPWWRVKSFRAYAAWTRTDVFREALAELLASVEESERTTVVMCSESVWWRCHRRLISDVAVLLHGVEVHHLAHNGKLTLHEPAAGARVAADGVRYDLTEDETDG